MEKQMIEYKTNWWHKLKNKIRNMFKKKTAKSNEVTNEIVRIIETSNTEKTTNKIDFMDTYNSVKKCEVNLKELDKETLRKIMLLLKEEMILMNKKIQDNNKKIETSLYNLKVYSKEIEMQKKNY